MIFFFFQFKICLSPQVHHPPSFYPLTSFLFYLLWCDPILSKKKKKKKKNYNFLECFNKLSNNEYPRYTSRARSLSLSSSITASLSLNIYYAQGIIWNPLYSLYWTLKEIQTQGKLSQGHIAINNREHIWTAPQYYTGEGTGSPLQYSSLENPMDRGAWWAGIHGVKKIAVVHTHHGILLSH